ncbi:class I SAM-dependent methyltransferase [Aquibacillus sediminis]|uniref:class I SAM-dependent methyltransferase n=1 Tax=Aquibacillus sediminis TaxID=2574734 RepID=UPI0011087570|nr:class I SAM-dependent methyltransferase [Aquibacillus sediminis]
MLKRVIPYAHELLKASAELGETVIDGTCGKGNDTIFLSHIVGKEGHVLAFDIQSEAITHTKQRITEEGISNVTLIQEDHQYLGSHLSDHLKNHIGGAIFNLGYLPGSDKSVITKPESTIAAVDTITDYLKPGGVLVLVVYHGHHGGDIERDALLEHLHRYDQKQYQVLQYRFINQKNNPPFVLAIGKN